MTADGSGEMRQRLRALGPDARERLLTEAGREDVRLRTTFEALLDGSDADAAPALSWLESPAGRRLYEHLVPTGGVAVGDRIGSVRLDELLGEGGMGRVFRGWDEKLERAVAVKTIRAERLGDPAARTRFRREARILSQLDHPGICEIYDLVERPEADYLLLEFVEGETLRDRMRSPADPETRLHLAQGIAAALAAAHGKGIVHRDLKPDNVMVRADRSIKVLDFGIARTERAEPAVAVDRGADPVDPGAETAPGSTLLQLDPRKATFRTRMGSLVGTVAYMSPEQARGEEVTEASDLYSLGLIFQELFTGEPAHPAVSFDELLARAKRGDRMPLGGCAPAIAELVTDLVHRDPALRPPAAEIVRRLVEVAEAPARRRLRRLRQGAAALVALTAAAGLVAYVRSELAGRRHARLALEFAEFANEAEWRLRAEYLAPLHDVSGVESEIRSRIGELETRLVRLDAASQAAGSAAAGRAYLALGDPGEARTHLEAAWTGGERSPEVALNLGRALAEIYRQRLQALGSSALAASTADYRADLDRELARPALDLLSRGRSTSAGESAYVEALIALFEQRWSDAEASARAALAAEPWLYEAPLLEASIDRLRLAEALPRSDAALAMKLGNEGRAALLKATSVARSSPQTLASACEMGWLFDVYRREATGRFADSSDELDAAEHDCQDALVANPKSVQALTALAGVRLQRLARRGPRLSPQDCDEPVELASQALAIDPKAAQAYHVRGMALQTRASMLLARGTPDPESTAAALADFGRAAEIEPQFVWRRDFYLQSLTQQGATLWWHGDDPEEPLREAIRVAAAGWAAHPEYTRFAHKGAVARMLLGRSYEERGLDGLTLFEEAARDCRAVVADTLAAGYVSDCALVAVDLGAARLARGSDPSQASDLARRWSGRAVELGDGNEVAFFAEGLADSNDALWAHRRGADPAPSLEAAESAYRRGYERSPANYEAPFEWAQFDLLAARDALAHGRSPAAALDRAGRRIEMGLERGEALETAHRVDAERWLLVAESSGDGGVARTEALVHAEAAARRALERRRTAEAFSLVATSRALLAADRMRSGESAAATIDAGLDAARQALAIHPRHLRALAALVELDRLLLATGGSGRSEIEAEISAADRQLREHDAGTLADLGEILSIAGQSGGTTP